MTLHTSIQRPRSNLAIVVVLVTLVLLSSLSVGNFTVATNVPASLSPSQIAQLNLAEWTLPTAGGAPWGISVDPAGSIWTVESSANKIARLVPSNNTFTEWTIPTTGSSSPLNIVALQVPSCPTCGTKVIEVFFTESAYSASKIGRFYPSNNSLMEWQLGAGSIPVGISVEQVPVCPTCGTDVTEVFFSESGNNRIGRLIADNSSLTEWVLPGYHTTNTKPWGIQAQVVAVSLGAQSYTNVFVWFTEDSTDTIGRLETTSNRLTLWNLTTLGLFPGAYQPTDIALGLVGGAPVAVFADVNSNRISVLGNDTGGGSLYWEARILSGNATVSSQPAGVAFDSARSAFWFAESKVGNVANLNTTSAFVQQQALYPSYCTMTPLPSYGPQTPLCAGSAHEIIIGGSALNVKHPLNSTALGSVLTQAPVLSSIGIYQGGNGITEYQLPTHQLEPTPTSFSLDSAGNIWFTESNATAAANANKIGRLSIPGVTTTFTSSITPSTSTTSTVSTTSITSTIPVTSSTVTTSTTPTTLSTSTTSTITPATGDFSLNTPSSQITAVQGSRTNITLTVTSIGAFNGNVALDGTFSPSAPGLTVTFSPSTVTPPPYAGVQQTVMSIVSRTTTSGTYTLTITGTSTAPSITHQLVLTVLVSPCLIATATFGSVAAPAVQFLRDFRDRQILSTSSGSAFMVVFNAWYYSFSPSVAGYISTHALERTVMKGVLIPLIGILEFSSYTFSAVSGFPELAVLLSGLVASSLIGALYLGLPFGLIRAKVRRLRGPRGQTLERTLMAMLLGGVAVLFVGELLTSLVLLMASSALVVLSAMFLSAAYTSRRISGKLQAL